MVTQNQNFKSQSTLFIFGHFFCPKIKNENTFGNHFFVFLYILTIFLLKDHFFREAKKSGAKSEPLLNELSFIRSAGFNLRYAFWLHLLKKVD